MDELFDIFKVVIILTTGLGLGFIGTSLIHAIKTDNFVEEEETKPLLKRIKYIDRYKTDISGQQQQEENIDTAEYRTIYEHSPNGGIFLKYNKEDETFEYWGSNSISYEVLCVSIRKYCVQFFCAHLYQDIQCDIDSKQSEPEISKEEEDLFLFHPKTKQVEKKEKDISGNSKPKLPKLKIRRIGSIEDYDILTGRTKAIDDSTEVISWSSFKKIKENMK